MATVVALHTFVGVLSKDVLGKDRIEKHSEFKEPSVFPGGDGFPAGSLERKVVKEGERIQVLQGQKFDSNHPAVKKWPQMFSGDPLHTLPVEQATALPGPKRGA